jgi:hypothetical protein
LLGNQFLTKRVMVLIFISPMNLNDDNQHGKNKEIQQLQQQHHPHNNKMNACSNNDDYYSNQQATTIATPLKTTSGIGFRANCPSIVTDDDELVMMSKTYQTFVATTTTTAINNYL